MRSVTTVKAALASPIILVTSPAMRLRDSWADFPLGSSASMAALPNTLLAKAERKERATPMKEMKSDFTDATLAVVSRNAGSACMNWRKWARDSCTGLRASAFTRAW